MIIHDCPRLRILTKLLRCNIGRLYMILPFIFWHWNITFKQSHSHLRRAKSFLKGLYLSRAKWYNSPFHPKTIKQYILQIIPHLTIISYLFSHQVLESEFHTCILREDNRPRKTIPFLVDGSSSHSSTRYLHH